MQTVDVHTWELGITIRKENDECVTVLDALDNCHFMDAYLPYFGFIMRTPCCFLVVYTTNLRFLFSLCDFLMVLVTRISVITKN